mgnify:CR=1 FL=1
MKKRNILNFALRLTACLVLVSAGILIGITIMVNALLSATNVSKEDSTTEFWHLRESIAREVNCEPEDVNFGWFNNGSILSVPKEIRFDDSKVERIIDRQIAGDRSYSEILFVEMSLIDNQWHMTTNDFGLEPTI